ncbi:MAG TPA: DUF4837 family protein [Candidatus Syntrophosphaera thermopropionivorans]|jgi:hypothetical protein|nr:DUF4837 family protein [Candidatus Syntrophosphaera sp.]NLA44811.1 DUF4837 family protein [Candidatus Cloacimonadota bacterium]HOH82290.1 DUF4837 family protein [Candidatus Syntrophosphaera thermopropionivorans]MBP9006941.1 DUF4837 family protein [Candidatus Syntrophosphaera sp.]HOD59616.1 DUF4837 family protein [Candidatus Syntrophosphaera sp.]
MKKYFYIILILILLLFSLFGCKKQEKSQEPQKNFYTKYQNLIDPSKPIAFGDDNIIYIFAEDNNLKNVKNTLQTSLERTIQVIIEEPYFSTEFKDGSEINDFTNYKNLIYCGTLDGKDRVSTHITSTLAPDYINLVRKNGAEMFVVNNFYVRDQLIIYLVAKDAPTLKNLTKERSEQVFNYFLDRYKQRLAYQVYFNEVISDDYFADWPFTIKIPVLYMVFKDDKPGHFLSFIYQPAKQDTKHPDKYVSIYYESMPENRITNEWIYNTRQMLGKKYLNGDEIYDNAYTIEKAKIAEYDGLKMYGHWINKELSGGVGGAFQSWAFWDARTKTAYLIDNIVYMPAVTYKLPYLLELEMISHSISIK